MDFEYNSIRELSDETKANISSTLTNELMTVYQNDGITQKNLLKHNMDITLF